MDSDNPYAAVVTHETWTGGRWVRDYRQYLSLNFARRDAAIMERMSGRPFRNVKVWTPDKDADGLG